MNFNFANQINQHLEKLDFNKAIEIAETELKKIPNTEFHFIIDKTLTGLASYLSIWINDFYQSASKIDNIEAIYFEMNEFDINTDMWYIDCFSFNKDGGLDLSDMEWLCEFNTDNQSETNSVFQIKGLEKLQTAFETIELNNDTLQDACDWCEQLIICRFMELLHFTHLKAKEKELSWASVPIYFTEHAYDFILKSE